MHHQAARACVDRRVHEGDSIEVGSTELFVLSTPGHTHDGISLLAPDALIAGDLFHPGARGHGDEVCADRTSLSDSLRRLAQLDPTLPVYGTHSLPSARPEPLLAALAGATDSTSGPAVFPPPSRIGSDFVPPTSVSSLAILRANTTCTRNGAVRMPPCCQEAPEIERISPTRLAQRMHTNGPPHVIDVRSLAEFESDPLGRIPGSLLLPLEHLEAEADNIKALGGDVVLTCRTTLRSVLGADVLLRAGVAKVSVLTGGIIAWRAEGLEVDTSREAVA
jgi:rhodanese-related sulfurtransferase